MNVSDSFRKYTKTVCEQIRWKKAHPAVAKEIENHLIDQKNAYLEMGDSESIAEEKTLLQMGDPVAIGAALDSTHKPVPQWGMMGLILLLCLLGAGFQLLFLKNTDLDASARQMTILVMLLFMPITLTVFFAAYFLDFSFFGKHQYLLSVLLFAIEIFMQLFGITYNGQRQLVFDSFTLSPATLSLLFPLAFCGIFYHLRKKGTFGYFLGGISAALFCFFLLSLNTAGGLFLFLFSAGILMLFAAKKNWFGKRTAPVFIGFVLAGIAGFLLLLLTTPYKIYRLQAISIVLHPESDPFGIGYLPLRLREMLDNSIFLGSGTPTEISYPAHSLHSEFLLTSLTYQYGWAVSIGLVLLLAVFLVTGFRKCRKQKSAFGQMVSLTILCTFTAEILIYVIANLGYPLIAPLSLPFLCYGTDGLVCNLFLAGILLSVFRTGEVYLDNPLPLSDEKKFIQWTDGKLIISFR